MVEVVPELSGEASNGPKKYHEASAMCFLLAFKFLNRSVDQQLFDAYLKSLDANGAAIARQTRMAYAQYSGDITPQSLFAAETTKAAAPSQPAQPAKSAELAASNAAASQPEDEDDDEDFF